MRWIATFIAEAWALTAPYWRSEERWRARLLLAVVIALNLSLVGMTVLLTYWQRAFYNTLETKDWDGFIALLFTWHRTEEEGFLPGFSIVAALYILIAVYQLYLRQALQIRWRRWLTETYLSQWLADRAYYRMALTDPSTDNPDQRIADDARLFVEDTLSLGIGLLNSAVTLGSFIIVLWSLSGPLTVFGFDIPGYMVWVALIYAVIGTWLAHLIGRPLIALNFTQQKVEADFRYALVRFRENTEGIALYGGEADEQRGLAARFRGLMENWRAIMLATKRLTFFTAGYGQMASIFPIMVAAPAYFAGRMPLGGLIQTSSAFGQVQGALSWFVDNYARLTEWRATVERLTGFTHAVAPSRRRAGGGRHGGRSAEPARCELAPAGWPSAVERCQHGCCAWRSGIDQWAIGFGQIHLVSRHCGDLALWRRSYHAPGQGAGTVHAAAPLPSARHVEARGLLS